MMRGKLAAAMAVRAPNGDIFIHKEPLGKIYSSKISKVPFLRGLVMLWDALGLGIRMLTMSANVQTGEDEKIEGPAMFVTLFLSLAIAIGLFFLLPAALGHLVEGSLRLNAWWGNLAEGLVRLLILVLYIAFIGRIPEIQRVFAYHGAEHKTINAFEAGAELTPQRVACYSVEHPRCGTAFLLTLVLLSIVIFSLLGPMPLALRLATRILLIPVLAGVAYEYIRWTARHLQSPLVRLLIRPNLALQHLTTREPSLDMLEVSISAFNTMIEEEQALSESPQPVQEKAVEPHLAP
jgi:uncharacterized protein YqhQ